MYLEAAADVQSALFPAPFDKGRIAAGQAQAPAAAADSLAHSRAGGAIPDLKNGRTALAGHLHDPHQLGHVVRACASACDFTVD